MNKYDYIYMPKEVASYKNILALLYQNNRRNGVYVCIVVRFGFKVESFKWYFIGNISRERWLNYACALYNVLRGEYFWAKYVGVYFYNDNKINVNFIRKMIFGRKFLIPAGAKLFYNFNLYDYTDQCFSFIETKMPSVIYNGERYIYLKKGIEKRAVVRNYYIDKAIEKMYNVNMEDIEFTSRIFINVYFKESIKKIIGTPKEIRKKKCFLMTYGDTLNFNLALYKNRISFEEFSNWLFNDVNFKKIFEWLKSNKKEVIEFILLSKAGFYGENLKNKYSNINENLLIRLLNSYLNYENTGRHQKFIGREGEATGGVLGGEDPNPSVFIEEKE